MAKLSIVSRSNWNLIMLVFMAEGKLDSPEKNPRSESISNSTHDINNNNAPLNIVHLFEETSSIHSYYTRSSTSGDFYVKSSRLAIQKHSFSRLGVKL